MILPDADGFIVAAQKALEGHKEVILHNAEGDPVAVLIPVDVWRDKVTWVELPPHDHIEPDMGWEVPWLPPEPEPLPADYGETAQ